jgi:hypothetical protein
MFTSLRRLATLSVGALALVVVATPAQAQNYYSPFFRPGVMPGGYVNPNPYVGYGLSLQQYAYNNAVQAQVQYRYNRAAAAAYPPYYPPYGPLYSGGAYATPYIAPIAPAYNPYLSTYANPYVGSSYGGSAGVGYGSSLSTTPGSYGSSLSTTPGYGGWSGGGWGDPWGGGVGGAFVGLADLTNANAQYEVTINRARLLAEEVTRSRLETRRRIQEEAERERRMIPTPEEIRGREQQTELDRARREPPVTDIFSGRALNALLAHLQTQQGKGLRGPNVSLDEIDMAQINVVPEGELGNIGLVRQIKAKGDLVWPSILNGDAYKEARTNFEDRLVAAVNTLRANSAVADNAIRDLEFDVKRMMETLNGSINDLSPSQYIQGKRFLNQLQDAVTAMKNPKAVNYFNGEWAPKGKNVAELVNNMKQRGLRFAAAAPGGEPAYRALHRAMTAYDANMTPVAARP